MLANAGIREPAPSHALDSAQMRTTGRVPKRQRAADLIQEHLGDEEPRETEHYRDEDMAKESPLKREEASTTQSENGVATPKKRRRARDLANQTRGSDADNQTETQETREELVENARGIAEQIDQDAEQTVQRVFATGASAKLLAALEEDPGITNADRASNPKAQDLTTRPRREKPPRLNIG